ncbi:MAG: hypothetical protein ACK47E_04460 [Cyclobacteriaceae bacterium]
MAPLQITSIRSYPKSNVLASASDSSGKPTARNERGLAADSAVPPRLEWQAVQLRHGFVGQAQIKPKSSDRFFNLLYSGLTTRNKSASDQPSTSSG